MFLEYGSFMEAYDVNIYPEKPFIWEQWNLIAAQ
jgi:hypothetical protein